MPDRYCSTCSLRHSDAIQNHSQHIERRGCAQPLPELVSLRFRGARRPLVLQRILRLALLLPSGVKLSLCQLEFLQQRGECPVAPDLRLIAQRLQAAPLCRQRLRELCDLFLRVAQLLLLMPRAVGWRACRRRGGGGHVALLQH